MQRLEDSGKVMSFELKKEKGISREGFSLRVRVMPGEESSSRNKSGLEQEMGTNLSLKELINTRE